MHRDSSADPGQDLSLLPLGNAEFLPPDLNLEAQPFVVFSWERNGQIHHFRSFPFCCQLSLPFQHLPVNSFFGPYGAGKSHPVSSFAAGKPPKMGLIEQDWVEEVVGRVAEAPCLFKKFFLLFLVFLLSLWQIKRLMCKHRTQYGHFPQKACTVNIHIWSK